MAIRNIYLKIERLLGYSPVAPQDEMGHYHQDCAAGLPLIFCGYSFHVPCFRMTIRAVCTLSVFSFTPKSDREQSQETFTTLQRAALVIGTTS